MKLTEYAMHKNQKNMLCIEIKIEFTHNNPSKMCKRNYISKDTQALPYVKQTCIFQDRQTQLQF